MLRPSLTDALLAPTSPIAPRGFDPPKRPESLRLELDVSIVRQTLDAIGFVHLRGVIPDALVQELRGQAERALRTKTDLARWRFPGKKQQVLFDYGDETRLDAFKDLVAGVSGMDRSRVTLCERHIKIYDAHAPATPSPHKDRAASQLNLGLPIVVGEGSHLVVYPNHGVGPNRFNSTATWRNSLTDDEHPDQLVDGVEPVRIYCEPGDLVIFSGSTMLHERIDPAGTWVLYMKFNDDRLDPLGEDPETSRAREQTLRTLESEARLGPSAVVAVVSPRVEFVQRYCLPPRWKETVLARVDGRDVVLSEAEFSFLRAAALPTSVATLLDISGASEASVRRLAAASIIELAPEH